MIELVVTHEGEDWVARSDVLTAKAPTLEELDNALRRLISQGEFLKPGEKARLFMAFDNSTIPQWMRQYSQHYFNRIIHVEKPVLTKGSSS